jgi:hypothetical protein
MFLNFLLSSQFILISLHFYDLIPKPIPQFKLINLYFHQVIHPIPHYFIFIT